MSNQTLQIAGMSCAACQQHVERALRSVPGVESANVNLLSNTAQIISSQPLDPAPLIQAVRHAGYDASEPHHLTSHEHAEHDHASHLAESADTGDRAIGLRALITLIAGLAAMVLSMPLMAATSSSDPLLNAATRLLAPLMPAALMNLPAQPLRWLLCALALAAMVIAGPEIYANAWRAARHRTTNMNTLIALGTLSAFAASFLATLHASHTTTGSDVYFESVILILAFLLTGRWLEARARHQATSSLRGFAELTVPTARVLDISPATAHPDYAAAPSTTLPLDAVVPGDLVRILAGDRVPLDGVIVSGRSSLDESLLTGEPLPVTRTVGERVTGGSLNLDGVLVVRATAVGAGSTLAGIQRLLTEAQSSRAPMQRLADRVSAIFVPAILILAAVSFAAWALALNTGGRHQGLAEPFAIAIAVLIIACPCAMGLAVPAAITVALGRGARAGLLIKGGESLERLTTLDTLAFDKTGTLTLGRPRIAHFAVAEPLLSQPPNTVVLSEARLTTTAEPFSTTKEQTSTLAPGPWTLNPAPTLIALAAAVERSSTHPLAQAVVDFAAAQPNLPAVPAPQNIEVLPGTGIRASLPGHTLALGNAALLPHNTIPAALATPPDLPHATPLYLLLDNQPLAVFFATDQLRPESAAAVRELRTLNIDSLMLTGDTPTSAEAIAREAGITNVRASLLPAGKLEAIRELQSKGHHVGMAGDGINDAASLAQSDAGFAMPSGTELAREAGDVLLLHPNLTLIPQAFRLSRRALAIMRQNLGWAILYNLIGVPLAAGVLYPHFHILLSPVLASAAMALSSVSVLLNSLRLRNTSLTSGALTSNI